MTDASQIPPHDEAAELSVLGTVLLSFDASFAPVATLAVDDFFVPHHREAWAAILAVAERRVPVDVISVGDELKSRGMLPRFPGGWSTWAVGAAGKVSAPEHIEAHAEIVHDKATLRRLIALCTEVQASAYSGQQADEVMGVAREGLARLELQSGQKDSLRLGEALGDALATIEQRTLGKTSPGISYGLEALDDILGGAKPGQFILVAARPGMGKSAKVQQVLTHAATKGGVPSHLFSLEMLMQETVERALAGPSRVPAYLMGMGRLDVEQWQHIQSAGGKLYDLPLWVDDRSRSLGRIVAKIHKWHAMEVAKKAPIGLVAIDYLQRVRTEGRKTENRDQEIGRISAELKSLAMELHIPIIAVAALSRETEKRRGPPMLSDLRECGNLEYDADVVIFIHRDIPLEDQKARRESGPAELIVAKHRGGPTGVADVFWNAPLMEFAALDTYHEPPHDRPPNWQHREG
jgi:replicative DNA helicase